MNRFIKLITIILFLGMTQIVISQEMMYKPYQKVDIPFYDGQVVRDFLKQRTAYDTLWLPVSVTEIGNSGVPSFHKYEYNENGLLKKYLLYDGNGDLIHYTYYNNTYLDPLMDVPDTIFHRIPLYGQNQPRRYYYNNRQADSSYFEEYFQLWDGEKWNTEEKTYVHLLDTASVSEFQDRIEIFNRYGQLKEGMKTYLTFDDQGNVVEILVELYDVATGQYKIIGKTEYLYDDDVCHSKINYTYTSSGTWQFISKLVDMKWFEFHGFNNGDMLFHSRPAGLYFLYSPKNKNKISSYKCWSTDQGATYLFSVEKVEWKLEPFSYHYKNYSGYNMCLNVRDYYEYNEHHHIIANGQIQYNFWICDTVPYFYVKDDYINKYDNRGRRNEYIQYNSGYPPLDSVILSTFTYTVDSFTYVLRPVGIAELPAGNHTLLIVPNPSGETVRITAADEVETVSFYTVDGRLAYSRNGTGKEMNVNIQGLAAGVYVVQARLKNGGVQTGKVVVR